MRGMARIVWRCTMRAGTPFAGRQQGQIGRLLLLLGLCATAVLPQGSVLCHGPAHIAVEPAWASCCAAGNGQGPCGTLSVPAGPDAGSESASPHAIPCSDVLLGTGRAIAPHAPSLPTLGATGEPTTALPAGLAHRRASPRVVPVQPSPQVQKVISTTVLTI